MSQRIDNEELAHRMSEHLDIPISQIIHILDKFHLTLFHYLTNPLTTKGGIRLQKFGTIQMYLDVVMKYRNAGMGTKKKSSTRGTRNEEFYDKLIEQLIYYNNKNSRKGRRKFYKEYIEGKELNEIERSGFAKGHTYVRKKGQEIQRSYAYRPYSRKNKKEDAHTGRRGAKDDRD